jgi:putative transposase
MILVERHLVKKGKKLFTVVDKLCFQSKNLYNAALYQIKQEYFSSGKIIRYHELERHFKENNQADYRALPNNSSQQILQLLDRNLKSYFKLIQKWKRDQSSLSARPRFPRYKHKTKGRNMLSFSYQQVRIKNGMVYFPKLSGLPPLKTQQKNLKQVRIVPQSSCYVIEIVYEKKSEQLIQNGNKAAIDMGIDNLAALTFNNSKHTYLINGRPLKSINQYYNKKKSKVQSDLKTKHNQHESHKTRRLTQKRNHKIQDYLHKSSRIIVEKLKENQVSQLVIGYNKEWKQNISIGKVNNQKFVSIPFLKFMEQVRYKCQLEGIQVVTQEESYTSKCSALDQEPIQKQKQYQGRRVKRGLFVSRMGILVHADVNGSLNIGRKAFGDEYACIFSTNRGYGYYPVRVNPYKYRSLISDL